MNDRKIDPMLDAHAWPDMPSDAHQRVRDELLGERARTPRRWLPIAAGFALCLIIGGLGGYTLAPRAPAPSVEPVAITPKPEASEPTRVIVNASVFSDRRPALVRRTDPSSWGSVPSH